MDIKVCWEDEKGTIVKQGMTIKVSTEKETVKGVVSAMTKWYIYLDVNGEAIGVNSIDILNIVVE